MGEIPTPELLGKGVPTKPPTEEDWKWLDCPNKDENGCEYHVRVLKGTESANVKQHLSKACPLHAKGDEIPDHWTEGSPAPAGGGESDMPSEPGRCPEDCGDKCDCRETPKHSWTPLDKALSDEEKYATWVARALAFCLGPVIDIDSPRQPERHPNSARFHELLDEAGTLHDLKQGDYGKGDDPFANVRASEEWGIEPWIGAMVRLNDKVRRLQSLATKGTLNNEAAIDSFMDIAVYALIARILYEQERDDRA